MENEIVSATFDDVLDNEARVNVTWSGQNGDLAQPVPYDASDAEIRQWVTEAVRSGSVPGMSADESANFDDFVVDRFEATDAVPFRRIFCRPKTPFGVL